jgi:hypothetical protein
VSRFCLEEPDARHFQRQFKPPRQAQQLILGSLLFGDVGVGADDALRLAVGKPLNRRAEARDPDVLPVPVPLAILHVDALHLAIVLLADQLEDSRQVLRVHPVRPHVMRVPVVAVGIHAAHRPPGARMVDDAGAEVGIPDALARAFERHLPAAFRAVECRRNVAQRTDVVYQTPQRITVGADDAGRQVVVAIGQRNGQFNCRGSRVGPDLPDRREKRPAASQAAQQLPKVRLAVAAEHGKQPGGTGQATRRRPRPPPQTGKAFCLGELPGDLIGDSSACRRNMPGPL